MLIKIVFIFLFAALISLLTPGQSANAQIPDFPSCESYLGQPGDKAHFTTGTHQIVGGSLIAGSDDVYSLAQGNFLQCFCPVTGNDGIQTNWLRTDDPVSGWFFLNGLQWNLGNFNYAAQNSAFNCRPTPTPTSPPSPPVSHPQPGNGGGSASAPNCDSAKPLPPTNFQVNRTGTTARLTWTESANTTHYSILYGVKPGEYLFGVADTGKTSNFTVGSLDPGQKYYFAIRSVNNCMPSDLATTGEVLGASSIKGLANTGSISQIALLFAVSLGSFILILRINKLIRLSEKSENVQFANIDAEGFANITDTNLRNQLWDGNLVCLGQILQSFQTQLLHNANLDPTGRGSNLYRYRSGAPAYSFAFN